MHQGELRPKMSPPSGVNCIYSGIESNNIAQTQYVQSRHHSGYFPSLLDLSVIPLTVCSLLPHFQFVSSPTAVPAGFSSEEIS